VVSGGLAGSARAVAEALAELRGHEQRSGS
jgi:hypothetical protein